MVKINFLLFFGSLIILIVGLVAAFMPGLAYVTVYSYFQDVSHPPSGLPYVVYHSLNIGTHQYTARFLITAIGGLIGLFTSVAKSKRAYLGVASLAVASFGLILPATGDTRVTFPEIRLFDSPWVGSLFIVTGISLMFLGLIQKAPVPKASLFGLLLLWPIYLTPSILILANYLQWIPSLTFSPFNLLMYFMFAAGVILMIWGVLRMNKQAKFRDMSLHSSQSLN